MNARTMIVLSLAAASVLACRQEDRPSTTTLAAGDSVAGDSVLLITRENEIAVDTEPALVVIARTVRGPYSLHPTVFCETRRYVEANYPTWLEYCLGIYPQDPDAVPADSLTWDVAFPIAVASTDPSERSELLRGFSAPQAPYELRIIEGGTVATLRTT